MKEMHWPLRLQFCFEFSGLAKAFLFVILIFNWRSVKVPHVDVHWFVGQGAFPFEVPFL